jgi:hypothetical protein
MGVIISVLTAATVLGVPAQAHTAPAPSVENYSCKRLSGGPMAPLTLTIDHDKKTVDLPTRSGLITEDGSVTVTDQSVKWFVARGAVEFDRHTLELSWDMTDDHDYLEATGQFVDPVENYRGKLQCTAVPSSN